MNATSSAMNAAIGRFWRHADRLFKVLSKAWNCNCWQQHYARLLLQHRTSPDIDFRLLFLFNHSLDGCNHAPWKWRYTDIKLLDIVTGQLQNLNSSVATNITSAVTPPSTPNHRSAVPFRPAMTSGGRSSQMTTSVSFKYVFPGLSHI